MTVRVATVVATGKRYLVNYMTIGRDDASSRVTCWGDVVAHRGVGARHMSSRTFVRTAVQLEEVDRTEALIAELFDQHVRELRDGGRTVEVRSSRSRR